jgi:hypothetical protein
MRKARLRRGKAKRSDESFEFDLDLKDLLVPLYSQQIFVTVLFQRRDRRGSGETAETRNLRHQPNRENLLRLTRIELALFPLLGSRQDPSILVDNKQIDR